jgi:Ca-activated chloride channel family protein
VTHIACAAAIAVLVTVAPAVLQGQQPIRSGVDLVNFGVVVTDRRGAPISGLTKDDFEVIERGKPQQIQFFSAGDEALSPPLHLGFLLDASGSMDQDLRDVQTAAIKFLGQNEHAVDTTLVDFDTEIRTTIFRGDNYQRLVERIRMRRAGGMTAFYDAMAVYLRNASVQDGQKILVVYTDGGDTRSTITASDVSDLLKASDVTMYTLGYLEHQSSSYRSSAQMELQRFSQMTGGLAFFPSSVKELDAMYEKIVREMDARYILGYTSTDQKPDGSWRPVEIRLKRADLKGVKLRTRPGYYAPLGPGSDPAR